MKIYENNRSKWEKAAGDAAVAWNEFRAYRASIDFMILHVPNMLKQLDADTQSIESLRAKVRAFSDALNAAGVDPHDVLAAASKSSSLPVSEEA